MMKRHSPSPGILAAGLCALILFPAAIQAQFCGENDPARPVPECVNASGTPVACNTVGAIQLWPGNFRPGGATRGGQTLTNPLPLIRDSTQRIGGTTVPGERSGHELFKSVAIVGNRLYVAYNAGLQVYNLATDPEDPPKNASRDGWLGHFLEFPPSSEQLTFVEDIDAIDPGSGLDDLIFLSGKDPVGPSIWRYNGTNFTQLYQDEGTFSRQVRVAKVGTTVYGLTATNNAVHVYNLSVASNLGSPCLDDQGTRSCGVNVYRGSIPGMTLGRYLDVIVSNGRLFVATTDGLFRPLQIWELPDPNSPANAIERYNGNATGTGIAGPAFFEYNNTTYLAFTQSNNIKIYEVDDCLDLNGCSSLGDCKAAGGPCEIPFRNWPSAEKYVTYSESEGTPFLYYGGTPLNVEGPKVELLVDVSELGASSPSFPEITDGAGTYTDPCSMMTVDYWGYYYPNNNFGLRNFYPRIGKFKGAYFYRAAQAILDVHLREDIVVDPTITVTAQTPADENTGAYWFGDPISFAAINQNCFASGTWLWDQTSPQMVDGLDATGNSATLTWGLCNGGVPPYCPDETVTVTAVPTSGCGLNPNQVMSPNPFVLKDPRARIDAINNAPSGNTHPAGTDLVFTADVQGKTPLTYNWSVLNSLSQEVASGTGSSFTWTNTCEAINVPEVIFQDSFENGDILNWSFNSANLIFDDSFAAGSTVGWSSAEGVAAPPAARFSPKGVGELFEVRLTLANSVSVESSAMVTLVPPGSVSFDPSPVTIEDLGGGTFRLTANTTNATEWRWEIEDPDGEDTAACTLFEICQFLDWGVEDNEVVISWQQTGMFNVRVWARNSCVPEVEQQADTVVDVTEVVIEPLEVTSFAVDSEDTDCSTSGSFTDCLVNRTISFDVSFTGNPTTLQVDWENNGTFVNEPVSTTLTHIYTSTTITFKPRIRAIKGAATSAERSLLRNLTITNSL